MFDDLNSFIRKRVTVKSNDLISLILKENIEYWRRLSDRRELDIFIHHWYKQRKHNQKTKKSYDSKIKYN